MSKLQAVIEINGNRYDARSGHNIDGILPADEAPQYLANAARLSPEPLTRIVSRPTMDDVVRAGANPLAARSPQPARTLMRSAVKKPEPLKKSIKVSLPHRYEAPVGKHVINVNVMAQGVNPHRLKRAKHTKKSLAVKHFRPIEPHHPVAHVTPPHVTPHTTHDPSVAAAARHLSGAPSSNDLFANALKHANSHKQAPPAKQRKLTRHATRLAVSFAAILVVTGALASYSLPSVKMHIAGAQAGFSAALPGYRPAGYHLSAINYNSGMVASNFISNSDQRAYTLTERPAQGADDSLIMDFLQKNASEYHTGNGNGFTVYLYGNNQATWLKNGVWYQLQSNGSLSDLQLVDLANSL